MADEVSYVLINPYTLLKSRTGNILNRLLSRTALDLAAVRMFAPGAAMARAYADCIRATGDAHDRRVRQYIREYVLKNYSPDKRTGARRRVMAVFLRGEDAVARVREVVGRIREDHSAGETIRDTYGDYVLDDDGKGVRYFEPAVLAPATAAGARERLAVLARFWNSDGGFLEGAGRSGRTERTLVMLKPDNFRYPSGRPGLLVDAFSRTGLRIVAAKMHRMSVAEAEEFYGPVLPAVVEALGPEAGRARYEKLVEFMCGRAPSACPAGERERPGTARVMVLVYEGADAVRKVRAVLGPTDPEKAPPGTVRREFGTSMMINAAHASDSEAGVARETAILRPGEDGFDLEIAAFLRAKNG